MEWAEVCFKIEREDSFFLLKGREMEGKDIVCNGKKRVFLY